MESDWKTTKVEYPNSTYKYIETNLNPKEALVFNIVTDEILKQLPRKGMIIELMS